MVNIDDFIKRLEIILDYYNLSASAFADKINVQRSSLSHLLSGRNKPSLDFIIKVIEVFPEVDLYWILNGKGTFPKSDDKITNIETTNNPVVEEPIIQNELETPDLFSAVPNKNFEKNVQHTDSDYKITPPSSTNNIERIVIFYQDGTFKNYIP
ncbi:MAG: helix-turn-helix domain-containing protein [Flavobacterium sp.]|jgi:transcriptional regulator with XRE-family HTH domain|uniref:Helix-turn-helix transcriptional regulator n=1 Tax=Flavobacterium celericrescens TaxID=2709780 RepID=A0ABX0ID69_9FLAO|nr:helix-turn-helix transcriptional regulator [Flavobacterium celericrescens]NHM05166.1 helix-turn-helix transcriptional regulator [Flavobacterium celericrescens]